MTLSEEHDLMLVENIRKSCERAAENYRQNLFTERMKAEPELTARIEAYYARKDKENK